MAFSRTNFKKRMLWTVLQPIYCTDKTRDDHIRCDTRTMADRPHSELTIEGCTGHISAARRHSHNGHKLFHKKYANTNSKICLQKKKWHKTVRKTVQNNALGKWQDSQRTIVQSVNDISLTTCIYHAQSNNGRSTIYNYLLMGWCYNHTVFQLAFFCGHRR